MLLAQNILSHVEGFRPTSTAIRGSHVACNTALRGVGVGVGILSKRLDTAIRDRKSLGFVRYDQEYSGWPKTALY